MNSKIYVVVVQEPMVSLDCTDTAVFSTYEDAKAWMDRKLEPYRNPDAAYTVEEMNYEIYEHEVDNPDAVNIL